MWIVPERSRRVLHWCRSHRGQPPVFSYGQRNRRIGRRSAVLVGFSDFTLRAGGREKIPCTRVEKWSLVRVSWHAITSLRVAGKHSIRASRISTSANCGPVGTSINMFRRSWWADCLRSRSFPFNLHWISFPVPGGIGPPHLWLIRDKSSRLGNCRITEVMCVVRTSEKVIPTERVDGGNCPRAWIKPGSMAVRPIKVSFRTFEKWGILSAKSMGTSGSMKQKDRSRTSLAGLSSG